MSFTGARVVLVHTGAVFPSERTRPRRTHVAETAEERAAHGSSKKYRFRCEVAVFRETGIDWLIAGGESGPRHRRIDIAWVRALRAECDVAGVAFFFKQWGGARPESNGRELDGRVWDNFPVPKERESLPVVVGV